MDQFGDGADIIIAGASGLVGKELTKQVLSLSAVSNVYTLVRRQLPIQANNLHQIQDNQLRITHWEAQHKSPDFGFICLGTTKKQAGSKQALAQIDFELVCQVARTMKMIGVRRIAVVSSYGANPNSFSHYLRCKGKMEQSILTMGFERVVFVRPGPLAGNRLPPRNDEVVSAFILKLMQPILMGSLANLKPILAQNVAKAMLYATFKTKTTSSDNYITLTSIEMNKLLASFQIDSK